MPTSASELYTIVSALYWRCDLDPIGDYLDLIWYCWMDPEERLAWYTNLPPLRAANNARMTDDR